MNFEEWYQELQDNKSKDKLPKEFSTQTAYLVVAKNEIVGILNVRWDIQLKCYNSEDLESNYKFSKRIRRYKAKQDIL